MTAHPVSTSEASITPLAEFRRWLVIPFVVPIVGASAEVFVRPISSSSLFYATLFMVASACEAWLQFGSWLRRLFWTLAGLITGILVGNLHLVGVWFFYPAAYAVPAFIEFRTANGVRNRPWAWLVCTCTVYGSALFWVNSVANAARKVVSLVFDFTGMTGGVHPVYAGIASVIALMLMVRAVMGSFVASRRYHE